MTVRIAKWGNSIGVRVPAALAAEMGLAPGSEVDLVAEGHTIRIVPQTTPKRYKLKDLLAGITHDNVEPEIPTGPDVGREVIE